MRPFAATLAGVALFIPVQSCPAIAQVFGGPPDPPVFAAQTSPSLVSVDDILSFQALPEYHEPEWVTRNFVETGRLPPVAERLPKEPLVYRTGNMPDGIGVYGDVLRHITGGRPEGWNFMAGQSQGTARLLSSTTMPGHARDQCVLRHDPSLGLDERLQQGRHPMPMAER